MLQLILHRPYVVAFFLAYLLISIPTKGWRWTTLFLLGGYCLAWASEALSIRTGFPYGWYHYLYENLQGEILVAGVPLWDSASYVFLCFAGMGVAEKVCSSKNILRRALTAAFFVTLLDAVIDPLAHRGADWFLGQIYFYPEPGFYFDVPLSNFAGWFLVAFLISWFGYGLRAYPRLSKLESGALLLYFSIFLFNWAITLWLKLWGLALVDLAWISIPLLALKMRQSQKIIRPFLPLRGSKGP